jgi:nucleoside triphosphate pyrophosphatase
MRLILASASPRRAELLTAAGFSFEVAPADVDEIPGAEEAVESYTLRVARDKANRIAASVSGAVVLAADTEVVVDRRILGKPSDADHAAEMLRLLSGRHHEVLTAIALIHGSMELNQIVTTRVHLKPLSEREIEEYIGTGEPMGKAGAYGIQGYAARFIDRIEGSWSNVVGLPIHAVHELLERVVDG